MRSGFDRIKKEHETIIGRRLIQRLIIHFRLHKTAILPASTTIKDMVINNLLFCNILFPIYILELEIRTL